MFEGLWHSMWLGLAALAAGAVNSIAGGGTLLTFPGLLTAVSPACRTNVASLRDYCPARAFRNGLYSSYSATHARR
jgi:hypothetical protein